MTNPTLPLVLSKSKNKIYIEISKDKLESFMNISGLFQKDFLNLLKKSEADHKSGRITKRKSLKELMDS